MLLNHALKLHNNDWYIHLATCSELSEQSILLYVCDLCKSFQTT